MKRIALHLILISCLFLTGTVILSANAGDTPNVLLIISDDQAWADYGFMGHPHVRTPKLDKLAGQSLTFTRGYVAAPLCRPSLASMATGLYPHQHGITGNDPKLPGKVRGMAGRRNPDYKRYYETLMRNIEQHDTLPRLLAQKGYLSLQTGKWWEGPPSRGGFTHAMTHGDSARGGRHGDVGLEIGRKGLQPIYDFVEEAQDKQKPFFIWYAPFLPHTPHNPPERLLSKYTGKTDSIHVAKYWAMCEWFDETCGELLDYLERKDLAKDTIVLYVCDNGWIQSRDSGKYAPRSKRSPYEGGIRTPIMVRWPGRVEPGTDRETLVSSVDLAPTILAACGLEKTPAMTGVNLVDAKALGTRKQMFGEAFLHDVTDVDKPTLSLTHRWMVKGPWKLILPDGTTQPNASPELYQVIDDPWEKQDLAGREVKRVKQMTASIDEWWKPER